MGIYLYDESLVSKLKDWTDKTQVNIYGPEETKRLFEVIADKTNDKSIKLPIICLRRARSYSILNTNKRPITFDGLKYRGDAVITVTPKYFANSGGASCAVNVDSSKFIEKINDNIVITTYEFIYVDSKWELFGSNVRLNSYGISIEGTPHNLDSIKIYVESDYSGKMSHLNAIPVGITYQLDVYTRYQKEADSYIRNLVFNILNYPTLQVVIPYNDSCIVHNANIRLSSDIIDNSNVQEVAFKYGQFSRYTLNINIDDAYLWDVRIKDNVRIDSDSSSIFIKNPVNTDFTIEQL